jgi:hypothetical protein
MVFLQEHDIENKAVSILGTVLDYADGYHHGQPMIDRTTRGTL